MGCYPGVSGVCVATAVCIANGVWVVTAVCIAVGVCVVTAWCVNAAVVWAVTPTVVTRCSDGPDPRFRGECATGNVRDQFSHQSRVAW